MNVNENLSSVSSVFDLKSLLLEATVCGMSSSLIQVTVVPAFTVMRCGAKVKLSIFTCVSAACAEAAGKANAAERTAAASAVTIQTLLTNVVMIRDVPPQPCSGLSMIASRCCPRLKVTSVTPSSERSLSSATFIGPGEGAAPGAGCGKAVDMAV